MWHPRWQLIHHYITLRGEAVADLVPAGESKRSDAVVAVDEMLAFMQTRKPVGGINIKALINAGRALILFWMPPWRYSGWYLT